MKLNTGSIFARRFRTAVAAIVILAPLAAWMLYAIYDKWQWHKQSDEDIIASIYRSLPPTSDNGRKIAVISNVDENLHRLLRGYVGISPEADIILEPKDLDDLARKLKTLGRAEPISRLTFFGRGEVKGDSVALEFIRRHDGVRSGTAHWKIDRQSFVELQKTHGDLPVVFTRGAQIVFFTCWAGRDNGLLKAAGAAFLRFKGGKVMANREAVKFKYHSGGVFWSNENAVITRLDRPLTSDSWVEVPL